MNFNRVELKWSQFGVKAINMDFKIIPHVNVTYSPKQVRQVTHILRRVLNFSITRKINSPHSYIQLSVTSNKSSTQRNTKPKRQAVLSCPWPVPLEPALTGEATACGSPTHICSPSFLTSPCHRPVFVAFFSLLVRLDIMEYVVLQLWSILPLMVLILCSSLWFRCFPSLPPFIPLDAIGYQVKPLTGLSSLRLPLFRCISANLTKPVVVYQADSKVTNT